MRAYERFIQAARKDYRKQLIKPITYHILPKEIQPEITIMSKSFHNGLSPFEVMKRNREWLVCVAAEVTNDIISGSTEECVTLVYDNNVGKYGENPFIMLEIDKGLSFVASRPLKNLGLLVELGVVQCLRLLQPPGIQWKC